MERGIDEVGCSQQFRRDAQALRRIRQIDLNVARPMQLARLPSRQRDNFAPVGCAEVPHGCISHQPGRARDHHLLVRHLQTPGAIARL